MFSSHHTLLRLDKAVDTGSNHRGESGAGGGGWVETGDFEDVKLGSRC